MEQLDLQLDPHPGAATEDARARATIVRALREIGGRLRLAGDNPFRARAYDNGANAVEALSDAELAERVAAATLTEVPGIGGALAAVITEVAQTGRSTMLD